MKKTTLIISIIILIALGISSGLYYKLMKNKAIETYDFNNVYEVIDFEKANNSNAQKILYKYILELTKSEKAPIKDNIERFGGIKAVRAIEFDLNNDGKNEIIGFMNSTLYCGSGGCALFILEKKGEEYIETGFVYFNPDKPVSIMKNKTNGYYDIKKYNVKGDNIPDIIKRKKEV